MLIRKQDLIEEAFCEGYSYAQKEYGLSREALATLGLTGAAYARLYQASKRLADAKKYKEEGNEEEYLRKALQAKHASNKAIIDSLAGIGVGVYGLNKLGAFDPIKALIKSKLGK